MHYDFFTIDPGFVSKCPQKIVCTLSLTLPCVGWEGCAFCAWFVRFVCVTTDPRVYWAFLHAKCKVCIVLHDNK